MIKPFITLLTGTVLAQIIPIALTPLLSRLYTPEDFGVFAIFTTFVLVANVFSTGKYELAIAIPQKDRGGVALFAISILLSLFFCLVLFLVFYGFSSYFDEILNSDTNWLFYVPVVAFLNSVILSFTFLNNRLLKYKDISTSRVVQASILGGSNSCLGYYNYHYMGFIYSSIISTLYILIYFYRKTSRFVKNSIKSLTINELIDNLIRYKRFPKYLILGGLCNTLASQLPIILFTQLYGASTVGAIFMTQRIISLPTGLISRAVGEAARQSLSNSIKNREKNCKALFLRNIKVLFLVGLVPFVLAMYILPDFLVWLLGEKWHDVGVFAQILMPMYYVQFCVSSLSSVVIQLTEKLATDLIWQVCLLISTFCSVVIGHYIFDSMYISLILFAIAYSIMYLVAFGLALTYLGDINESSTVHN